MSAAACAACGFRRAERLVLVVAGKLRIVDAFCAACAKARAANDEKGG